MLSTVIGVVTGYCLRLIGLGHHANDFCISCSDEEEGETALHVLRKWPEILMSTDCIDDLGDLTNTVTLLCCFIGSSK